MISPWALSVVSVILQYGVLFFMLCFLWQMGKRLAPALSMKQLEDDAFAETGEAILTVLEGTEDFSNRRFAFQGSLSIGRAQDNDIVVSDAFVSHHHAVLARVRTLYTIADMGSANHTYVNGELLTERRVLKNGDRIRIGRTTFLFER